MESRAQFVGKKIVSARRRKGMSQQQLAGLLAGLLNRSPDTIRRSLVNWEGGKNEPRAYALEAIAAATEQPLDFFAVTPVAQEAALSGEPFRGDGRGSRRAGRAASARSADDEAAGGGVTGEAA